ncbi:lasso peptide biosynthesis PqqD family chaperone [Paenibacillus tarimensis]
MTNKLSISFDQMIVQAGENLVSDMNGEKVMMSVQTGKYYNMGQVGGRIWELIATPVTANHVIETLLSEYKIGRADCEEQVLSFLNALYEQQLVRLEDAC